MFGGFPLLGIAFGAYNWLAFIGDKSAGALPGRLIQPSTAITLASGTTWSPTLSDFLIGMALAALGVDLVKMVAAAQADIEVPIWSGLLLFVCCLEFLAVPAFATSTFALITLMALVCLLANLALRLVPRGGARRQFRSVQ